MPGEWIATPKRHISSTVADQGCELMYLTFLTEVGILASSTDLLPDLITDLVPDAIAHLIVGLIIELIVHLMNTLLITLLIALLMLGLYLSVCTYYCLRSTNEMN
jgi:hypothetical protein